MLPTIRAARRPRPRLRLLAMLASAACVSACGSLPDPAPAAPPAAARPLFEVEPFEAWRVVGGAARYEFPDPTDDGDATLVGRGPIPRNGFLASPRPFGDFRLAVDVRIGSDANPTGEKMNSGIQIRSRDAGDRIVGLQIEIDPSPRAWSGGVYDEGGRAWLAPLEGNDAARAAFRLGDWNRYDIEAVGPRIRTRVNGVPAAEWFDGTVSGLLAFQVHGGPACEVRFRDARIEELGSHGWSALDAGAPLPADAAGVRARLAPGESLRLLDADGRSLAEVPAAAEGPRLAEILWKDGEGAVLVDGRRVAGVPAARAPAAVDGPATVEVLAPTRTPSRG